MSNARTVLDTNGIDIPDHHRAMLDDTGVKAIELARELHRVEAIRFEDMLALIVDERGEFHVLVSLAADILDALLPEISSESAKQSIRDFVGAGGGRNKIRIVSWASDGIMLSELSTVPIRFAGTA